MLVFGAPVMDDKQNSGGVFFTWLSKHKRATQHAHTCYLVDRSGFKLLTCLSLFPISSCCIRLAEPVSAQSQNVAMWQWTARNSLTIRQQSQKYYFWNVYLLLDGLGVFTNFLVAQLDHHVQFWKWAANKTPNTQTTGFLLHVLATCDL